MGVRLESRFTALNQAGVKERFKMTPEAMDMVPIELPNEELQAPSKEPIYAVRRDEQPHREIVVWSEHSFDLSTMASGMQRSLREMPSWLR